MDDREFLNRLRLTNENLGHDIAAIIDEAELDEEGGESRAGVRQRIPPHHENRTDIARVMDFQIDARKSNH